MIGASYLENLLATIVERYCIESDSVKDGKISLMLKIECSCNEIAEQFSPYVGEILKRLYEFLIGFMFASSLMIEISLILEVKTMLTVTAGTALLGWSGDKCFQYYEEDYITDSTNHR